MQIEVTNIETGTTETYSLSKDNWRRAWACMKNGLVHSWVPPELPIEPGRSIITSGRRYKVIDTPKT